MRGELDESLARLELDINDNEGYNSEEGSMSNFGTTTTTGLGVSWSRRIPGMISPKLTSDFGNDRICELVCSYISSAGFLTKG